MSQDLSSKASTFFSGLGSTLTDTYSNMSARGMSIAAGLTGLAALGMGYWLLGGSRLVATDETTKETDQTIPDAPPLDGAMATKKNGTGKIKKAVSLILPGMTTAAVPTDAPEEEHTLSVVTSLIETGDFLAVKMYSNAPERLSTDAITQLTALVVSSYKSSMSKDSKVKFDETSIMEAIRDKVKSHDVDRVDLTFEKVGILNDFDAVWKGFEATPKGRVSGDGFITQYKHLL